MKTGYKQTPIGSIPKEWEVVRLGDISKVSSGNTAPQDKKYFENGKYPFIRVQHLSTLLENKYPIICDFVNDLAVEELKLKKFKKGSIIFPKSGESIRLEKRAILREDSYVVNHLVVVEVFSNNVDTNFLYYYLSSLRTSSYLSKTTMPSLNLSVIKSFLIPLPPLPEQRKIAEILSTVDQAIQKVDEAIARTERLKRGLMQRLLTRGIGHREFKDTEIGRIPRKWEVVRLGDKKITEELFYGITAKAVDKDTGVKMLRTTDIKEYSVDWEKLPFCEITERRGNLTRYLLKKGDLIVARAGTVGVSILVDRDFDNVIFGSYLIKVKLKPSIHPKFVHYFFQSSLYWKHLQKAQGSTLKNVNLPLLKSLKIPLPPLPEQRKIAEIFSIVDKKLELERKRKEKLERIKRGLMNDLLTGKKRVKI
ncbi:MAG: restriction endonuclease subunit S [Candidatus Hadarchaeales archaeon]